ncbi:hypothetical protein HAX54_051952, partial [Datura stramonium]|nr:hypothetical protein [Datura stramonium]
GSWATHTSPYMIPPYLSLNKKHYDNQRRALFLIPVSLGVVKSIQGMGVMSLSVRLSVCKWRFRKTEGMKRM